VTACIGEPVSWLRLERFALGAPDPAIASHLAACPACARCLDHIRDDVVALPPLASHAAIPARPHRARRRWLAPAFAAAAAAAIVLLVIRHRPPPPDQLAPGTIGVKGVGEVTLELVRERAGAIRFDATSYAPGDRWKVVVSCPPSASAWIEVSVADGITTDHPLAPAQVACGNRVVVPGAFTITGTRPNRVCARVAAAPGAEAGTACLTVDPDR
jgi:hypothetical protein